MEQAVDPKVTYSKPFWQYSASQLPREFNADVTGKEEV
ncbi:hypothetical protein M3J09_013737 [Ascochyta lentis]